MKQYSKLIKFVLATFMFAGITTSCVEKEQNPYFSENEDGTGNEDGSGFEAKLPDPGMISFFVGEEVIVKGSGFSNSDEIYLRNFDYEYNDDANGDGIYDPINIKAEIKSCTSDKLVFIVPEDFNPFLSNNYSGIVYLMRNGEEHKLGEINFNSYRANIDINRIFINGERFNKNEKVYYQNIIIDENTNEYQLIGEKQELPVINNDGYNIEVTNKYALGKFIIFVEKNGIFIPCESDYNIGIQAKDIIRFEESSNNEFILIAPGFLESDEFILKDYDNNPIKLDINRKEQNEYEELISLTIPQNIMDGYYILSIKRNGIEHIINENIYISEYK